MHPSLPYGVCIQHYPCITGHIPSHHRFTHCDRDTGAITSKDRLEEKFLLNVTPYLKVQMPRPWASPSAGFNSKDTQVGVSAHNRLQASTLYPTIFPGLNLSPTTNWDPTAPVARRPMNAPLLRKKNVTMSPE